MAVTVKDESLYHATEALILKSPRKYYRASMLAPHWQLRSIIDSPSPNIILYSNRAGICQLDTATCERETLACVTFSPRCLVAAERWVCCGGDNGDFASIHLEPRDAEATGLEADADSRLPLDLDPARGSYSTERSDRIFSGLRNRAFKASVVKSTKIGLEIVNCVTLWFPKLGLKDQTYEKPVAVLSNNDHSVAIVDLEGFDILETLRLDDCINRAVISPDGRLLVAVGDDPYMHIYHRKQQGGVVHNSGFGSNSLKFGWVKCQRVQLQGQRLSDKSDMRGSFATAFSPSGRYLAVGTQYGIVSVFEASCLTTPDKDPLIITFTTSRPNQRSGAVRALEFSPEPYDLLAWTENNGRAGVADIRRYFLSRQILIMDPAEGVDQIRVTERSDDLVIDPRLRQFRSDSDSNASDSLNTYERRQLRHLERELHSSLNPDELAVLEAIQLDRRQREREAARQAMTNATENGSSSLADPSDDMRSTFWRENPGLRRNPASTLPSSLREFVNSRISDSLRSDSLRAHINERNQERERRGQQPRSRGSVILAAAQSALGRESSDSQRGNAGDLATGSNRVALTPPRLPTVGSDSSHNPWAEIEALYNLAVEPPADPTARLRIELDTDNRREYTRRLERHQLPFTARVEYDEETGRPRTVRSPDLGLSGIRSEPLDTTGCCWSHDGKILYIGAENGIYEYHVNTTGRKFFPSLALQ